MGGCLHTEREKERRERNILT